MGCWVEASGRGIGGSERLEGSPCVLRGGQTGNHHSPSYFPSPLNLCADVGAGLKEIKETRKNVPAWGTSSTGNRGCPQITLTIGLSLSQGGTIGQCRSRRRLIEAGGTEREKTRTRPLVI